VARIDRDYLNSHPIEELRVTNVDGLPVLLAQVASIERVDGQTIIARENNRRRITVRCDIIGRDQGGFVAEAQRRFDAEIKPKIPEGEAYRVSWLGMFENLARARKHFAVLIPFTIVVIFVLLLVTFRSPKAALLVLLAVPFACVGGVL